MATVHMPAVAAGQPVSVALALNAPNAPVSASPDWETAVVPIALSREACARMAALVASLQSSVILVVPAVTPTISGPTTVPVPADTVVLHTAVTCATLTAAPADAGTADSPVTSSAVVAASASVDVRAERTIMKLHLLLVELFIGSNHPRVSNWKGVRVHL